MKTVSSALALHLVQPLTTMAKCCRIQWKDGTVLAFTSFDEPLDIEGDLYTPIPGVQDFAVQTQSSMAVDTTDILGAIDDDAIKEEDILDNKWDFAEVRFFEVNWQDVGAGILKLRRGWIGEIKVGRTAYIAEIRGLMQALTREIGQLYQTSCTADLGDAKCKVDLAPFTVTGTVTSVADRRTFRDTGRGEAEHYFDGGLLRWTSGSNNGKAIEIEYNNATGDIVLFLQMKHAIQIGDTYTAVAGCSKSRTDCVNKFNNIDNMRAFPDCPGADQQIQYPGAHV